MNNTDNFMFESIDSKKNDESLSYIQYNSPIDINEELQTRTSPGQEEFDKLIEQYSQYELGKE